MLQLDPTEPELLRERFRATRRNTIEALQRIADQLGADTAAPAVIEELRRELHRIHATASSVAFAEVQDLVGAFETRAIAWGADLEFEREQRQQILGRFISALDLVLSGQAEETATSPAQATPSALLLFIGDEDFSEPLKAEAALRTLAFRSLTPASASVESIRASGARVLMSPLPMSRAVADAARALNLPLVALENRPRAERGTDDESVSATATVDVAEGVGPAFEVASRLLERSGYAGTTILAVDDDPAVLALMRVLFPAPEFDLQVLQDGSRLFETLAATEPSLLLLDIMMPTANGIELLRKVRAHPTLHDLTVVLMSASPDTATRDAAFAAGADEFVAKPFVFAELRARVGDRLDRRRAARLAAGLHPATGIALPERAVLDGAAALVELREAGQPASVVVVRPAAPQHDSVSSAAWMRESTRVSRALRDTQRAVGYAEAHDLVLVLPATAVKASAQLTKVAAERPAGAPRWHAGVADLTDITGGDYPDARRAASEAADAAIHGASRTVQRWRPSESRLAPEVIILESDPTLSEMMQYALDASELRYAAFSDGLLALAALEQYDTTSHRPIVLIDVDLTGIDGYTVHDRLRAQRPGDYLVIIVTTHSSETDELRAIRAGAIDYIAKPVNLRILIAKISAWRQAVQPVA